jgi:hypothetical protein
MYLYFVIYSMCCLIINIILLAEIELSDYLVGILLVIEIKQFTSLIKHESYENMYFCKVVNNG